MPAIRGNHRNVLPFSTPFMIAAFAALASLGIFTLVSADKRRPALALIVFAALISMAACGGGSSTTSSNNSNSSTTPTAGASTITGTSSNPPATHAVSISVTVQ
jgi:hypothetical protein